MTDLRPTARLVCACGMRYRAANPLEGRTCICGGELIVVPQTRAELTAAHGTPLRFALAVLKARNELFCSTQEAALAIDRYRAEWERAS